MASLTALKYVCSKPGLINIWWNLSRPICTLLTKPTFCQYELGNTTSLPILTTAKLLTPTQLPVVTQSAGMKMMGRLRKRCKHCFFIMINERLHVWCDVHPRHKQMQMMRKPKTLLRITSATQHKIRPW